MVEKGFGEIGSFRRPNFSSATALIIGKVELAMQFIFLGLYEPSLCKQAIT